MLRKAFDTIRAAHRDYPAQQWHADGVDSVACTDRKGISYDSLIPIYGNPAYTMEQQGGWRGITVAYHPDTIRITVNPAWVNAMRYEPNACFAGLPLPVWMALGYDLVRRAV